MTIKKIILESKSWILTKLESDTILSYIFAFWFAQDNKEIINIFDNFKKDNILFNITNAFVYDWKNAKLPRFFDFLDGKDENILALEEAIKNEKNRKRIKKLSYINISNLKEYLEIKTKDWRDNFLKQIVNKKENETIVKSDLLWKNTIPRFNKGDTNTFSVEVNFVKYFVIYVNINDEAKFNIFYNFMKKLFLTIWFGSWKSRWLWKFQNIKLEELSDIEQDFFNFIKKEKEEWKYFILNNYKPSISDIENIDWSRSYIVINNKQTKTIQEFNKYFFKWEMNFISPWSVVYSKNPLKWDFYNASESYNFGFIF